MNEDQKTVIRQKIETLKSYIKVKEDEITEHKSKATKIEEEISVFKITIENLEEGLKWSG